MTGFGREIATIEIVEIIRRPEQGATRPYVCRAETGDLYFVKGKGAGHGSLAKEWIAGSLAKCMGLPIPDIAILTVPPALVGRDRPELLSGLGTGEAFGSKAVEGSDEIAMADIASVPTGLKREIAVFDWWLLNGDRTLSENGGNPNILWSTQDATLHVIDHNLAFDGSVTLSSLEHDHIFGEALTEVVETVELRQAFAERLHECLVIWDDIWLQMPERWNFVDDLLTMETGFAKAEAERLLRRCDSDRMWTRP